MAIQKDYYILEEAAGLLECSIMDLIHLGILEEINICFYVDLRQEYVESNGFYGELYRGKGYSGFFSVGKSDLLRFELDNYHGHYELPINEIYPYKTKHNSHIDNNLYNGDFWYYQDGILIEKLVIFKSEIEKIKKSEIYSAKNKAVKESPKGTDSLMKMVITMAIKGYSYNPNDKKSGTPSEIVNDADLLELAIDADTVRKWLKESAQLLPQKRTDKPI